MARILVVEDNLLVARLLEKTLTVAGHDVRLAADGGEGLAVFRDGGIDLVLTDLAMPEMDGFGLVQAIRESDHEVPILVLSATLPTARLESIEGLIQGVRGKPMSPMEVIDWVGETLSGAAPLVS